MKLTRVLISTFAIFGCGAIGHSLGSGIVNFQNSHYLFFASILLISTFALNQTLHGPKLALVITLSQVGTHIFFQESGSNDVRMGLAHLISGILTYQLITKLDQLVAFLISAIKLDVYVAFNPKFKDFIENYYWYHPTFSNIIFYGSNVLRAPPALLAN